MMMLTLIVEATHDGVGPPSAASFLVGVELEHRRRNDVSEASPGVLRGLPSLVADEAAAAAQGQGLGAVVPPAGAGGTLEDGHQ